MTKSITVLKMKAHAGLKDTSEKYFQTDVSVHHLFKKEIQRLSVMYIPTLDLPLMWGVSFLLLTGLSYTLGIAICFFSREEMR